ncbi:MAG: tyrosine-type recombinase/integrase, partial [Gammaproteobacteria bacterium]
MFLRCTPNSRIWNVRFTFKGKREQRSLGDYPTVPISEARTKARAITEQAAAGRNIIAEERDATRKAQDSADLAKSMTFGRLAREWLGHEASFTGKQARSPVTIRKRERWLATQLKSLRDRPMSELTATEVGKFLQAIEAVGARTQTARRIRQMIDTIWSFGRGRYPAEVPPNQTPAAKFWLRPIDETHHAGVTDPKQFGILMSLLDTDWGGARGATVQNALRFTARTVMHQDAITGARWDEMHHLTDPSKAEWHIPAARMKGAVGKRQPFIVPLSRQAVTILQEQRAVSAHSLFVFPHASRPGRGMSDGAAKAALGAMGYPPG